jgi:NhaA family Na+:H+ antiporter
MSRHPLHLTRLSARTVADRVLATLERFLYIEAVGGAALLIAAAAALIWANSPAGEAYQHFWHAPLVIAIAGYSIEQPLHFWINDGLMTVFFLVVGLEVRREIHEGALSSIRQAALPVAAAVGGVCVPALLYVAINDSPVTRDGWAVGSATDIAFALGVLALLGSSIPTAVRIFLLSIAIIDDILAVLIIALFYSGGLEYSGFAVAGAGVAVVLAMQRLGIGTAWAYVVPGAVIWAGLLATGTHPALAGVALGLLTPVRSQPSAERHADAAARALVDVNQRASERADPHALIEPLRRLRRAQRELVPPVVRVQLALHPWVAFGIVPLFALANAGVPIEASGLAEQGASTVMAGVLAGLLVGKPIGIVLGSWLALRAGKCALPAGLSCGRARRDRFHDGDLHRDAGVPRYRPADGREARRATRLGAGRNVGPRARSGVHAPRPASCDRRTAMSRARNQPKLLATGSTRHGASARRLVSLLPRRRSAQRSTRAVNDAAFRQIVRRQLDGDGVAFQDADVMFAHLARDVRGHDVAVLELDAKGRVR